MSGDNVGIVGGINRVVEVRVEVRVGVGRIVGDDGIVEIRRNLIDGAVRAQFL